MRTVTFARAEGCTLVKEDPIKQFLISWMSNPSVTEEGCFTWFVYNTRCGTSFWWSSACKGNFISKSNNVIYMLREGHCHSQNLKGLLFCSHSVNLKLRKGKRQTQNTAIEQQLAFNTFIKTARSHRQADLEDFELSIVPCKRKTEVVMVGNLITI